MTKRVLIAAVIAVAAIAAAGCGSDDSSSGATPTEEWADGLCSAVSTWKTSLTSAVDGLKGGNLSQESLSSAVDDAKTATDTFTSDLAELGRPDTDAGQQAKDAVDQLSTEIQDDMTKITDAVDNASGVAGILAVVPLISSTLTTAGSQVSATFTSLQSLDAKGELESAFKASSSCTDLTGS